MKKEDATVQVISTEPVSTVSTAAENKENSITTQQLGQENPKASSTESSTSKCMFNSDYVVCSSSKMQSIEVTHFYPDLSSVVYFSQNTP